MTTKLTRDVRRAMRAWAARAVLAGGLIRGLGGCATCPEASPPTVPVPRPISWQELPSGAVGIITTSALPLFRVVYPMNRDDAVEEAGSRGFWLGGEPYNEGMVALLTVPCFGVATLVPMAAASVGAQVVTHCRSIPDQPRIAAMATLQRAEQEIDFQGGVARELWSCLGPSLGRPIAMVPKPVPPIDPAEVRKMASFRAGTLAWLPDNITADSYLASHGVETVLEVRVCNAGLRGRPAANPSLSLGAEVEARLVRRGDGMVLSRARAAYASPARKFLGWVDRNGRLLQEEFVRGCAQLGRDLANGIVASFDGPVPATNPAQLVQTP
jgi:hypothetical protein